MSLEFFTDPHGERCLLVDGCYETALPCPVFRSLEEAESFVAFVRERAGRHVLDLSKYHLDALRDQWEALPKCSDCSRVLCGGECPDGCDEYTTAEQYAEGRR